MNRTAKEPTVLFVDDEPLILKLIRRELFGAPFRIFCADSPTEALRCIAEQRVDVVISDMRMQQMSGLELLDAVRSLDPHAVRVILTGQADLDSAVQAINGAAVYRFLQKPWVPGTMEQEVLSCLEHGSRLRRQSPAHAATVDMLERRHPGITKVRTGPGVAIEVEPGMLNVDLGAFLRQMEAAKDELQVK